MVRMPLKFFVTINAYRLSISHAAIGILLHGINQYFKKIVLAPVITLSDPDIFSGCILHSALPLFKSRTAVGFIVHNVRHFLMIPVLFNDTPAVIIRTIIKNDHFVVLITLIENRIQSFL